MTDAEWLEAIKAGDDVGWKQVWERVIVPEAHTEKSASLMRKYSITDGDLMGMLYEEMLGRGKISLYRGEGSLAGWLRTYVRGFIMAANPVKHGEISLEGAHEDAEEGERELVVPTEDNETERSEVWRMTNWCFRKLWNEDPVRCYIHVLKTRFFLSSEEIAAMLEVSSAANVDQIFSRSVKFLRKLAEKAL